MSLLPTQQPNQQSYKGLTGHWTKYGGGREEVFKDKNIKEWTCQSCGFLYPIQLSAYLYSFQTWGHIRVCALCFSSDCTPLKERLEWYDLTVS